MIKAIYGFCQKLHEKKLLPWFIWSFVYDRLHKHLKQGEQWA